MDDGTSLPPAMRALLDGSADGWMITSPVRDDAGRLIDFRFTYVNPRGLRAVGLPDDADLVGKSYAETFPATVTSGLLDTYIDAVERDEVIQRTVWYDDERLSGYFSVTLVRWGDGGFACCFANATSEILHGSPDDASGSPSEVFALLRPLYAPDGSITDFEIEHLNVVSMTRAGAADAAGKRVTEVYPTLEAEGWLDVYRQAMVAGRPLRHEAPYRDERTAGVYRMQLEKAGEHLVVRGRNVAADGETAPDASTGDSVSTGYAVVAALAGCRSLDEVLTVMAGRAAQAVGASKAVVWLPDQGSAGPPGDVPAAVRQAMEDVVATGVAIITGKPGEQWLTLAVATDGEPLGAWSLLFLDGIDVARRRRLEGIATQCAMALDRSLLTAREAVLRDELRHRAMHDPLTGLANRALLLDHLATALARARRGQQPPAVMLLDLDRFKAVNDSHGHATGDRLLVEVAQRLASLSRGADVVARLGGDEFVLVVEGAGDPELAVAFARRVVASLSRPFTVPGDAGAVAMGTSIGIAIPEPGDEPEDVIRKADQAMYDAKRQGRGRAAMFDATLLARRGRRVAVEHQLREALAADAIELVWQPVIDLRSGTFRAAEALVRLRASDGQLLLPGDFLAVADDSGLIVPLGSRVIELVLADLARWASQGDAPLDAHLNLSTAEVASPVIADALLAAAAVARSEDLGTLTVELTERTVIALAEGGKATLRRYRDGGLRVAMDDFGTGRSSLVELRRLPVDQLKIDRSLVGALGGDPADMALVTAIAGLAESLGVASVAEGVETSQQAELVVAAGCTAAQGLLYSRPVPAQELGQVRRALDAGTGQNRV